MTSPKRVATLLSILLFLSFTLAQIQAQAWAQTPAKTSTDKPQTMTVRERFFEQLSGGGTSAWTPEEIAILGKIRDLAMSDPYAVNELRHLCNNIGPRLSGSPQAAKAVEYVADEMRALGAEVTLEKAMVPHWIRGEERGELVSWAGQAEGTKQKVVLTALGGSVATPADGITADVIVVKDWAALKALPEGAAKGKILLFNHPFDERMAAQGFALNAYGDAVAYRGGGPIAGASVGAVAVLVRSAGGGIYRSPHTGMTMYVDGVEKIPAAAVTAEDAEMIADLSAQGPVKMHLTLTPQKMPDAESYNVIADWKGSEHPEQVVVVSGHLDSWDLGTGALDDGAGVVVAMQTIHLMKELGLRPRRTIRMIAWMSEEEGSEGAAQYAKDYLAQVPNHIGAIEADLGAGHPIGIYYSGNQATGQWLRPVAGVLQSIGANQLTFASETGEDIAEITQKGVPGFAPMQDSRSYFNYHHTPADTFDKVVPKELNENAAVMAVLAYALAASKDAAPR
jgi:hypothetical protein